MTHSTPLTIIIPVLNEGEGFLALWSALETQVQSKFNAFVVYDFDQDDTIPVVTEVVARGENRLHLIKNSFGKGVVGAIRTGFEQVQDGPLLVVMGDLSDDLAKVDAMISIYQKGFHLVAASRYMKGGAAIGGPWLKQTLSRLAGVSLYCLRGIPTHDATNAFKLYDSKMLRTLRLESQGGFELNLEIAVKAFLAGYKIAEIPARWQERTHGKSKFRLWAWLPRYLKWYFYAFRPKDMRRSSIFGQVSHS